MECIKQYNTAAQISDLGGQQWSNLQLINKVIGLPQASKHDLQYISLWECFSMTVLTCTGPQQKIESSRPIMMTQTFLCHSTTDTLFLLWYSNSAPPSANCKRHPVLSGEPRTLQELVRNCFDMYCQNSVEQQLCHRSTYSRSITIILYFGTTVTRRCPPTSSKEDRTVSTVEMTYYWHFTATPMGQERPLLISVSLRASRAVEKWMSNAGPMLRAYGLQTRLRHAKNISR